MTDKAIFKKALFVNENFLSRVHFREGTLMWTIIELLFGLVLCIIKEAFNGYGIKYV